jgi:hypothetical protein
LEEELAKWMPDRGKAPSWPAFHNRLADAMEIGLGAHIERALVEAPRCKACVALLDGAPF